MPKPGEPRTSGRDAEDVGDGGDAPLKKKKKVRPAGSASASSSSSASEEEADAATNDAASAKKAKSPTSSDAAKAKKAKVSSNDELPPAGEKKKKPVLSERGGASRVEGPTSNEELSPANGEKKKRPTSDDDGAKRAAAKPQEPAAPPVDPAHDALVALFAVRDDLATEQQIEKAIAAQRKRAEEDGAAPRLVRVLIEDGVLTPTQAKELEQRLDPEVIPGYRIQGEVGRGGMGTVYKAAQISMQRTVALKVLAKRLSRDSRYIEKFLYEARAAGKLNHEHIVQAIDCGAADKLHYFVMEFVDGAPVSEMIAKEGPLPWARAFQIGEQVARALDHAHKHGLVHRDVKPENIIISKDGRAKLCDLGLAKEAQEAGTGEKSKTTEGTPYYCSPEQALGRTDIDARSDVYALAATLYHIMKGEPPFDGESARQILWKQVHKEFPDLAEALPDVPPELRALLAKMVEKERESRLESMQAFLDEYAKHRTPSSPPAVSVVHVSNDAARAKTLFVAAGVFVVVLIAGIGGTFALLSGEKNVAKSPTPTPIASASEPPRGRITRVETTPSPSASASSAPSVAPSRSPASDDGDAEGKLAQSLLQEAYDYRDKSPQDVSGYGGRLHKVVDRYPGTPAASVAEKELATLTEYGSKVIESEIAKLRKQLRDTAAAGQYKDALELIDRFTERTDARLLADRKGEIDQWRNDCIAVARQRVHTELKNVDANLKSMSPEDAAQILDTVAAQIPEEAGAEELRARARTLRQQVAAAAARTLLQDVERRRDDALAKNKIDEAARVLDEASRDPRLAPVLDDVKRLIADEKRLEQGWACFEASIKKLEPEEKHVFHRRDGQQIEGQLKSYDAGAWIAQVKIFGRREQVALELRDVVPEELVRLATPVDSPTGDELAAACLYFIVRADADAASLAVDKIRAATGKDDDALREQVAKLRSTGHERRAAQLVARATSPDTPPEDVVALVTQLAEKFAATKSYLDGLDAIRRAYVAARVSRLEKGDISHLFHGKLSRVRDLVKLEYDMKDPSVAKDFLPDEAAVKGSTVKWQDRLLRVRGKALTLAVFEGGLLEVDLKAQTLNPARPNINITMSDKTGWQGLLLGVNFIYGGLSKVKVSPSAVKKPGWPVPLPANVMIDLNGKEPEEDDGNCLYAEERPKVPEGRACRVVYTRTQKGAIRAEVSGQTAILYPTSPRADEAGAVGIAPFTTELAIERLEITGKLETTSLIARAKQQAEAEAAALPGPKPATPDPNKKG